MKFEFFIIACSMRKLLMHVCVSFQCEQSQQIIVPMNILLYTVHIVLVLLPINILLFTVHIVLVLVPDRNFSFSSLLSLNFFLSSCISVFVIITELCEKLKIQYKLIKVCV